MVKTLKEVTGQTLGELMKEYDEVGKKIDAYYDILYARVEELKEDPVAYTKATEVLSVMCGLEFGSKEWKTMWHILSEVIALDK